METSYYKNGELDDKKITKTLRKLAKSYENGEIIEVRDELADIVSSIDEFVSDLINN